MQPLQPSEERGPDRNQGEFRWLEIGGLSEGCLALLEFEVNNTKRRTRTQRKARRAAKQPKVSNVRLNAWSTKLQRTLILGSL